MSGMLAKVMNSTVGTSDFKSLDVAISDNLYSKLKSGVRLIGSDDVLCQYAGTWSTSDSGSYEGFITNEFMFSHSGVVTFKTKQSGDARWRMQIYVATKTDPLREEYVFKGDYPDDEPFTLSATVTVVAGERYSVRITNTGSLSMDENLTICATPVMFAPTVTIV